MRKDISDEHSELSLNLSHDGYNYYPSQFRQE